MRPFLRSSIRSSILTAVTAVAVAALLVSGCGAGIPQTIEAPKLDPHTRALYARTNLEKARALRAEGRIDVASSVARRGLTFEPDNPDLLRLQAQLLEELGNPETARTHRERADAIDPPPPPLPSSPHPLAGAALSGSAGAALSGSAGAALSGSAGAALSGSAGAALSGSAGAGKANKKGGVLFVLLPPSPSLLASDASRDRVPLDWPNSAEARTLEARLRTRLPNARVELVADEQHPSGRSVRDAKAWLAETSPAAVVTLRVDRAFCGHSVKDGDFAVAWLRVHAALPGEPGQAHLVRVVLDSPPAQDCESAAVAQALERALELEGVELALQAPASGARTFTSEGVRGAFPILDWQMEVEVAQGRRYLSLGELELAREHFRQAERIDPDDAITRSFLSDVEHSLALASQLEAKRGAARAAGSPEEEDAQLSRSQRIGLEAQLADEEQRREQLLSALAVLYETRSAPSLGTVANMRPADVSEERTTGAQLALQRVRPGSTVEVRTLYGPGGTVIARYYFAAGSEAPVVREEDTDADGSADRWVGYDKGIVSDVWESDVPGAPPVIHVVYAPGGSPIERVELDHDADGHVDRVFVYTLGLLREESWDTDGDGAYDRFQRFDESGSLTLREEDVNGDEEIDVRTAFHNGRIVRREILNAELLSEIQ